MPNCSNRSYIVEFVNVLFACLVLIDTQKLSYFIGMDVVCSSFNKFTNSYYSYNHNSCINTFDNTKHIILRGIVYRIGFIEVAQLTQEIASTSKEHCTIKTQNDSSLNKKDDVHVKMRNALPAL